ncbi:MAG: hypothetical protein B7Y45_01195 [Sphingomonas sp. 28-66-16]|nr:MAG: hypothetical protein B7Y45_01195 [Sphingomonas sp. 28-66-16]
MISTGSEPVTAAHRRYIAVETAISVAINVVISIGFVFLVFGGTAHIAAASLIADAAPQSFMIALMSTIVPTLLTRRRRAAGVIAARPAVADRRDRALRLRAPLVAAAVAGIGVALNAALFLTLWHDGLGFAAALAFKAIYGGALGLAVTPPMLRIALSERL